MAMIVASMATSAVESISAASTGPRSDRRPTPELTPSSTSASARRPGSGSSSLPTISCTGTWSAPASRWARTGWAAASASPWPTSASTSRSLPSPARSSSVEPAAAQVADVVGQPEVVLHDGPRPRARAARRVGLDARPSARARAARPGRGSRAPTGCGPGWSGTGARRRCGRGTAVAPWVRGRPARARPAARPRRPARRGSRRASGTGGGSPRSPPGGRCRCPSRNRVAEAPGDAAVRGGDGAGVVLPDVDDAGDDCDPLGGVEQFVDDREVAGR